MARLGNHDVSVDRLGSRAALVVSHTLLLTNLCYVLGSHKVQAHVILLLLSKQPCLLECTILDIVLLSSEQVWREHPAQLP